MQKNDWPLQNQAHRQSYNVYLINFWFKFVNHNSNVQKTFAQANRLRKPIKI